jgi:RimJ/RimL family protein N-acetyltransferase
MAFLGKTYKCLKNQFCNFGPYSLIPIRYEDRNLIMQWRNEQMYHLRQDKPLTLEDQEFYFSNVIANLFEQEKPDQILFSYLEKGICIGYGGLVHINWNDRNAEISFIMKTDLEKFDFELHWNIFLNLIQGVAIRELNLIKTYTYAYDFRPRLYNALEDSGYKLEARLKKHKLVEDNFIDVLIHSKINE